MFVVVLAALALVTRLAQAEIVEPEDLHYGLFEAGVGHITDVEALVDVRSYIEFDTTHIEGAYNVDIRQMQYELDSKKNITELCVRCATS